METHDAETPDSPRSTLESAIQAVERSLCADGSLHGGIPEGEQSGHEWRALRGHSGQVGDCCQGQKIAFAQMD